MRHALAVDLWCLLTFVAGLLAVIPAQAAEPDAPSARRLLLTGRYAEAAEQYAALLKADPPDTSAALGLAQTQAEQGKVDEAVKTLNAAAKADPKSADVPAELAKLAFERGDYDAAREQVAAAYKLDPEQVLAHWIEAELHRTSGDMHAANKAYEWFVDYYNANDKFEPETLRYIGLAAAQFARWNRQSEQFTFLVNDLYPSALEIDENYWPAHYESGKLFLEKFNQAEASKSLRAALAINPNSAEVNAALAELAILEFNLDTAERSVRHALAINPRSVEAHLMRSDRHQANFEPDVAAGVLEKARKLNPRHEAVLGRLAASYGMVDGLADVGPQTRLGQLEAEALRNNPHCGEFYYALGEALDKGRKFPTAAHYFAKAVEVMPQQVGARGQLALMYMRLGEEDKARPLMEASFEIDPFNVRVSNSLKVLEVLDDYVTLETEHFLIRYDPKHDELLAKYAAKELERVYPAVCRRLNYEPAEKSLFEIFNRARNTDGHGWFSARMVGLPNIHTIGACAGKMVALTSPSAMKQRFNWARVLKHEFVHVVNLQQTNFNVPHWYTEALAVLFEESPRSADWNEMLARRVPAGEVFNLDTINLGFIRPQSSEDWQMAYCQAEIYAEHLIDRFGEDSLGKLLDGYRDNLNTRAALKRAFDVEQEDFEKTYTEHLNQLVASLKIGKPPSKAKTYSELIKAHAEEPDDLDVAAQLALAHLQRKAYPEAGKLADKVLKTDPKHQLATYVKAKLLLSIGETQTALDRLEAALDRDAPQTDLLKLLAGLKYKAEDYPAAAELYALGRQQEPGDPVWVKSLVLVHLKTDNRAELVELLEHLADLDRDDLAIRKKLAQLKLAAEDYPAAEDWANQCLWIDVEDSSAHQMLAQALAAQKKFEPAIEEYRVAIELEPEDESPRLALAETFQQAGRPDDARQTLEDLLKQLPDSEAGQKMLEKLKP